MLDQRFRTGTSASLETDFYAGSSRRLATSSLMSASCATIFRRLLAGAIKPNTTELYVAGGWKTISLKYSHSLGDTFGACDADGTYYLDLTGSWTFGDFTV
jgi:hypothetical protein